MVIWTEALWHLREDVHLLIEIPTRIINFIRLLCYAFNDLQLFSSCTYPLSLTVIDKTFFALPSPLKMLRNCIWSNSNLNAHGLVSRGERLIANTYVVTTSELIGLLWNINKGFVDYDAVEVIPSQQYRVVLFSQHKDMHTYIQRTTIQPQLAATGLLQNHIMTIDGIFVCVSFDWVGVWASNADDDDNVVGDAYNLFT